MKCPACNNKFTKRDITEIRRNTFASSAIKCPHCGVWLKSDLKSTLLLNAGAIIMLVGALAFKYVDNLNPTMGGSFVAAGLIILLIGSFFASKLLPCEARE